MPNSKASEKSGYDVLVVGEASVLLRYAQAGTLHLLHSYSSSVVVTDAVAMEATEDLERPGAREVQNWLVACTSLHSSTPVQIAITNAGRDFMAAMRAGREPK